MKKMHCISFLIFIKNDKFCPKKSILNLSQNDRCLIFCGGRGLHVSGLINGIPLSVYYRTPRHCDNVNIKENHSSPACLSCERFHPRFWSQPFLRCIVRRWWNLWYWPMSVRDAKQTKWKHLEQDYHQIPRRRGDRGKRVSLDGEALLNT